MKAYSAERKEALVRRMMPPENALVSALARETGITEQTLYTWRRQAKGQGLAVPGEEESRGMVFGGQVCSSAGNRAAQCSGVGRVLPSKRSLSRTDIRLASRLPFGQCECHGAGTRAAPSVEGRQEAHPAARERIAAQGEGAGGSGCTADSEKKSPGECAMKTV